MRLLLDEMYDPVVAERLRALGHDVVAAAERRELCNVDDSVLLRDAIAERRTVLTEDAADFMPIIVEMIAAAEPTWGLLLSSPRSMPRSKQTIGLFVGRLDAYLRARPAEDALADRVDWLVPER